MPSATLTVIGPVPDDTCTCTATGMFAFTCCVTFGNTCNCSGAGTPLHDVTVPPNRQIWNVLATKDVDVPDANTANTSSVVAVPVTAVPLFVIWQVVKPPGDTVLPALEEPQSELVTPGGNAEGFPLDRVAPGEAINAVSGRLNPPEVEGDATAILAVIEPPVDMLKLGTPVTVMSGTPIWKV